MNKKILSFVIAGFLLSNLGNAQELKEEKIKKTKKEENIIIKKNGDAKEKLTVVVEGETITINGVPIEDFKDENIEIRRSKSSSFNSPALRRLESLRSRVPGESSVFFDGNTWEMKSNKALLGVSTEKVEEGAKVKEITKASAAEKAGLKVGDIITKVNDAKISSSDNLYKTIGNYNPDEKVMITYIRDGKEATTEATLGKNKIIREYSWNNDVFEMPEIPELIEIPEVTETGPAYFNSFPRRPKLGMQIEDVEEGKGVKVLDVEEETPAQKAGLLKDDIITEFDGKALTNVDEMRTKLRSAKEGDTFKVQYKRAGKTLTTEIKIPKRLKKASL
jgi:serine protease Do